MSKENFNKETGLDHSSNGVSVISDGTIINDTNNVRKKGLSLLSGAAFIVGEMAGGGILTLSNAIAGTSWTGIALLTLCCCNAGFAGVCLAKCWLILEERWPEYRVHVRKPFATIGYRACGNWMKIIVSICMNLTLFGTATVFMLISSQLIQSVTDGFIHNVTTCDWTMIVAAFLTPLMWFGSPADFWPAAYTAMGATMIGSVLLLGNIIKDAPQHASHTKFKSPTFGSFFLSFGKILFAYGGACAFPSFQNDMEDKRKFPKAVIIAFSALLLLYLPISIGGYVVYGSDVSDNIIGSISGGPLSTVIKICFAVHLIFAFLIVINPVLLEIEELMKIPKRFGWKRCALRSGIMLCSLFLGESVPKFGKILDLIGGSTVTIMTFLMPPLFYYQLSKQKCDQWQHREIPLTTKIILIQIVTVGIIGGVASSYSAIKDMFDPKSYAPPCYVKNQ